MTPRVCVVHDYLTQCGGAERVVLSMMRAFPDAPIYTSLFVPERTFPEFRDLDVRVMPLNRVRALQRNHRLAVPFLAVAFSRLHIDADVIICSSSGWAHGARTTGRKIVYCHTPARWLYQGGRYLGSRGAPARAAMAVLRPSLVAWDRRAARSADRYLTQSNAVRRRIQSTYGIDAELLPAPASLHVEPLQGALPGVRPGFFLVVSRLLPYKNVGAIVEAFRRLPHCDLVVAGEGPERGRLRAMAGGNVRFLGSVSDAQLSRLYANCTALIAASYEDYGLTPLEAAAAGKPSVVLRWGGFLDTVVEGVTGTYFDQPDADEILAAVVATKAVRWDASAITDHATRYSEGGFADGLQRIVGEELAQEPNSGGTPRLLSPARA